MKRSRNGLEVKILNLKIARACKRMSGTSMWNLIHPLPFTPDMLSTFSFVRRVRVVRPSPVSRLRQVMISRSSFVPHNEDLILSMSVSYGRVAKNWSHCACCFLVRGMHFISSIFRGWARGHREAFKRNDLLTSAGAVSVV